VTNISGIVLKSGGKYESYRILIKVKKWCYYEKVNKTNITCNYNKR